MSDLVGQTIKGYEFLEHIGRGGFGAIYKAYQPILKREVAVKIILPEYANDPDFIRRFDVEAELIAQLEHPFIVPLYDYWRSPEGAYLVMRLLVEGSLRDRLSKEVIPLKESISIVANIADALHVAHRRNIVHRDVKPENILLDEDGRAYLTDFGIATLVEDDSKRVSEDTFSGSLIYAAPEQFTDAGVTSQTDIYALGIILYEMLMGATPYSNQSVSELVQAKLYQPVPDLEGTNIQYQERLNNIITRATASDISMRYQSIRDFKNDLDTALDASSDVTQPIKTDQLQLQEPSSIFVSYSRDDEEFAQKLSRDLRTAGHTVWLDTSDIRGGEEWIKSITSGIANAYAFISIMSDSAQESRWVQREFLQAEEDGKPIFPVTASETKLPIYMKERHVLAMHADYESNLETLLAELPEPPPVLAYAMTQEALVDLDNPYKGLQAFQEYDSANFFGRDDLTTQLVERMNEKGDLRRFLAVIGPSGSGKSSVVKAGLLPALRQGAVDNSAAWFYVEMFPGTQPFEELEAALLHVATAPVPNLMETLRSDARGLVRAVKQILPRDTDNELLIVIDQFEEIFTLVEDEEERQLFLYNLYQAVTDERSRIRIVVTLRADFYDKPLMYGGVGNLIRQRTEVVLPLSETELEQTIVRPAERAGAVFDPGLPQIIINDVMGQPGILPLLQYALTELFEQRNNRILSVRAYQKIGGVSGALAQRAEDTYQDYDESFQKAVRQIFLRLVTLGEGTEDTRRRIRRSEVDSIEDSDRVVDIFGKYRLLTFDRDAGTREPTIEVAHEALIRRWDRLKDWLSAAREDVRIQRRLTNAVNEWKENEKRVGFLARDTRLLQFEEWANNTSLQLNTLEREFLDASIAERTKREQEDIARKKREEEIAAQAARYESTAQQFRRASYVLGVVVFVAIVSGIGAFFIAQQQLEQAGQTVAYTDFLQARDATVVAGSGGLPADADALNEEINFDTGFATATAVVSLQAWQVTTQDVDGVTMVQVPAGCFVMGTERESVTESPVHEICFDAPFWVDQTEVTNAQFEQFNGVADAPSDWTDPAQPRTNISWQEAVDFCALRDARLLTEAEWEYAARGIDSTVYPWGNNDPVLDEGNTLLAWDLSEPLAVGSFAEGASWVGALDMSGNVWEWVSSRADPYPFDATDGREASADDGTPRILRGGAYSNKNPDSIRATRRFAVNSGVRLSAFGFRCAQDATPLPTDQSE